jgi:hypothetical protein
MDNRKTSNPGHGAGDGEGRMPDASTQPATWEIFKEVNQLPNPLAIGVTLGGLLLDVIAPRPKPRAGYVYESSLLSKRAVSRTPREMVTVAEYDGPPIGSAGNSLARVP